MAGKGAFWLIAYGTFSVTAFGLTLVSLASKAFDYLTLMHELTDNFKLTILLNFVVCCFLLGGSLSIGLVFGELRIIEVENIADQLPFYGLNLLFILFNDDNLLLNIVWAGVTMLAKVYHIIVLNRLDFVQLRVANNLARESYSPTRIFRIFSMNIYVLMLMSFIMTDLMTAKILAYDVFQGVSSMGSLLFGIQFGVMGIEGFAYFGKLVLNVYELMFYRAQNSKLSSEASGLDDLYMSDDEENSEIVWENKAIYTQSFEIVASAVKALFYSIFIYILYVHSGLAPPIPIIQGCFFAVVSVAKRLLQLRAYIKQSNALERLLANATYEELEAADYLCIICREDMHAPDLYEQQRGKALLARRCPKKLQCGHILHVGCLKDWLERSDNCPLCRKKVFGQPRATDMATTQAEMSDSSLQHTPSSETEVHLANEADANEHDIRIHYGLASATVPSDWTAFPISRSNTPGQFSMELELNGLGRLVKHRHTEHWSGQL